MNKNEIKKLIKKNDPFVLDIGCYDGKDSEELSVALTCDVYCFEPDPASRKLFRKKHVDNRRLHLYPYAVTNIDGVVNFFTSNHPQSNSMRQPKEHLKIFPDVVFTETIKVDGIKLDTWVKSFGHRHKVIDFIWADVNGSEADFILGAPMALSNTRYLYIEVANKELYEGQQHCDMIESMLPTFKAVAESGWGENFGNLLLKNMNL